jgi:hypothetical protein
MPGHGKRSRTFAAPMPGHGKGSRTFTARLPRQGKRPALLRLSCPRRARLLHFYGTLAQTRQTLPHFYGTPARAYAGAAGENLPAAPGNHPHSFPDRPKLHEAPTAFNDNKQAFSLPCETEQMMRGEF